MAFEAKLGQELRLRQQLVMTPQLQQAIKILQLAVPELETVVQAELEQNPMLEMAEPGSEVSLESLTAQPDQAATNGNNNGDGPVEGGLGEMESPPEMPAVESHDAAVEMRELNTLEKVDWREYLQNYSNNWQDGPAESDDEDRRPAVENTLTRKTSLEDHLMWQLRLSALSDQEKQIGATIIYNLNDDGYLETPLEDLAAQLECQVSAVEKVLKRVQRLDPPGVAARDLKECLCLQLANLGMEDSLAAQIVRSHLSLLEKHRYAEIAKTAGVSVQLVSQAAKVISLLEPKPARDYGGQEASYIVPDVVIHKMGDEYVVALNEECGAAVAPVGLLPARTAGRGRDRRNQGLLAGAATLGAMAGKIDLPAPADDLQSGLLDRQISARLLRSRDQQSAPSGVEGRRRRYRDA